MNWEVISGDKIDPKVFLLSLGKEVSAYDLTKELFPHKDPEERKKLVRKHYTTVFKAVKRLLKEGFLKGG